MEVKLYRRRIRFI